MTIPEFDENGNLPPGVHWAEWSEFQERFGTTRKRQRMIEGLARAMEELKASGGRTIYINGSFVTKEPNPNDFDACWDRDDVDLEYLSRNAPTLLNLTDKRFPSDQPVDNYGTISIDFFQRDRLQNKKGIIAIDLVRWSP